MNEPRTGSPGVNLALHGAVEAVVVTSVHQFLMLKSKTLEGAVWSFRRADSLTQVLQEGGWEEAEPRRKDQGSWGSASPLV